jgi:ABC-type polysaccharide/polyol phosphate export permease
MLDRPPLSNARRTVQTARPLFSEAIGDIVSTMRRFRSCFFLALTSVKLRYRRTLLGPLWITITTAVFIFFISYLHSAFILTSFHRYLLNLALGWIMWHFIYDSVLQGAQTFQRAADLIINTTTEKFVFVLKTVLANLIVFAHSLLITVPVYLVAGLPFSRATWLVIPALILIILSATWSAVIFGILCARYRDLYPSLQAIMRGLFFVTPILWTPDLLPAGSPRKLIVDLNPLAHYIAIWRKPMLGQYPDELSWLVAGGCTMVGLAAAFIAFARYRRTIVLWV